MYSFFKPFSKDKYLLKTKDTMIQIEKLIGIQELSKELKMNRYTIYKKMSKNQFPKGVKVNGRRMFKPKQIVKYFNDLGVQVTTFKVK